MNRDEMRRRTSDALYGTRNEGLSMETAIDRIVDAILSGMGDDTAEFHVRKDAPETSKAIVDKIRGGSLQDKMLFQYQREFRSIGGDGFTDDEMEQIMGRTHQSVSATRNTLMRKGYLIDSGMKRTTRSGNAAIVYVWTGKAQS